MITATLALIALTACGGNDTTTSAQSTQIPTPTAALTPEPTATAAATATAIPVPTATPTVAPEPTPTATPTPPATPTVANEPTFTEQIQIIETHLGPGSGAVWDGEAAWIVGNDYGDGVRLSPDGEILLKQNMGRIPSGLTTDGESVYVSDVDAGRVVRYGLDGIELSRFKTLSPSWVDYDASGLWVTTQGTLSRYSIDGELVFKMEVPVSYATGAGRLFVLDGTVLDIYAVDGSLISTVTLAQDSRDVQFFDESIWMFSENNTQLTKYDTDGAELETWTDLMGSGSMQFENGNIWIAVVEEVSKSAWIETIDLIRMNLATGVTQLILSGVDNGVGAVGDDHYFHGTAAGKVFIIDLDIEGEVIVEPLQDLQFDSSDAGGFRR